MATNTIRLHRVLRATPERIYRAFLAADATAKWCPPNGFTGKVHHLDAKVGGTYKMSSTNFTTGKSHAFGGRYLELVPDDYPDEGIRRDGGDHRARRGARGHSSRGVLSRLAGIAHAARETGGGRDSRVAWGRM